MSPRRLLALVVVAAGFVLRLVLLGSGGTHDVGFDASWGRAINAHGFAHAYSGNYFPLQYHVFQLVDVLARALDVSGSTVLKGIDTLFDAGVLVALVLLAERMGLSRRVALVYWLAPYCLAMDWLGYIDFQMAFFAVLGVLVTAGGRSTARLLAAGACFGVAGMMKPQALTLAAAFAILVAAGSVWSRRRRELLRDTALLVAGPAALFVGYSAWLTAAGRGPTYLAQTMLRFGGSQGIPLSANMTNLWIAFAEHYRRGSEPVYAVVGPLYLQRVAVAITTVLLLVGIVAVARGIDDRPLHESMVAVFAIAALTVPMTMTRAHENHLFLGFVFGAVAGAMFAGRAFRVAFHAILALQFVALVSVYQLGVSGPDWPPLRHAGSFFLHHLWGAAGLLAFGAFCVAYSSLVAGVLRRSVPRPAPLPVLEPPLVLDATAST